jgi:hypothetical protein
MMFGRLEQADKPWTTDALPPLGSLIPCPNTEPSNLEGNCINDDAGGGI